MPQDAIDSIYEAALLNELWPTALELLRDRTRSELGVLIGVDDDQRVTTIASPGGEQLVADYAGLDLFARSLRLPRLMAADRHDFVTDDDLISDEERRQDPAYAEFLHPRGLGHGTASLIRFPEGGTVLFDFERSLATGAYDNEALGWLNGLRPHLGRAATLLRRIELQRARDRVDVLNGLGIAAAALDRMGRALALNTAMEAHVPSVIADRREGLAFADREVDRLWRERLAAGPSTSASFPARRGRRPLVAHLLPVVRGARDVLSLSAWLLLLVPARARSQSLPSDVIQVLFDLTPAEARVACALANGIVVSDIATALRLSEETIRSHVKSIMRKTASSRQNDLVALFSARLPVRFERPAGEPC